MTEGRKIIVGTRGSKLALTQARMVVSALQEADRGAQFELRTVSTQGDKDRKRSLDEIGGQGVFVKELETALTSGAVDMAVHSLKDVPAALEPGLELAAVLPREDTRDVLVSRGMLGLRQLPQGARVGTDSRRRSAQLRMLRPDLVTCPVRGNIDTRLRKAESGEFDAVIVAAAALARMGWTDRIAEYLPEERFLPAVGQGAIAIELRSADAELQRLVSSVNHLPTWWAVIAERAFLRTLGGGCRAPIAALGAVNGDQLHLDGMVATMDFIKTYRDSESGPVENAERIGETLALRLLERAGGAAALESGRTASASAG